MNDMISIANLSQSFGPFRQLAIADVVADKMKKSDVFK